MFLKLLPEILRYVTTTTCIIALFFALSRPKYKMRLYLILAVAVVATDAIVCTTFSINNKLTEEIFYSIAIFLVVSCGLKFLFKDNILQWTFNCITVYIVHAVIFFISFYLGRLVPLGGYGTMLFRVTLFGIFITLFYRFLRPLYLEVSESWGIFILPILGLLVSYIYLILSEGHAYVSMAHNFVYFCFLTGVTILTYVAIIGTIFSIKKKNLLKEENLRRKANEELLLNELNSYHEFVSIAKESRHDMRHHNAVLAEYLSSQNIESAKQYLNEHLKSIDDSALTVFCKNPLANAVLRVYEKRMKDLGIEFVLDSEALGRLPFSIIETSTVLSNILENAVEATEKSGAEKKFIRLKSSIKDNKLTLEVENTCEQNENFVDGLPISTKEGGGTGLKSIKSVIEKYNGLLSLKLTNEVFVLRLIVEAK